jgi:hypothetical protein
MYTVSCALPAPDASPFGHPSLVHGPFAAPPSCSYPLSVSSSISPPSLQPSHFFGWSGPVPARPSNGASHCQQFVRLTLPVRQGLATPLPQTESDLLLMLSHLSPVSLRASSSLRTHPRPVALLRAPFCAMQWPALMPNTSPCLLLERRVCPLHVFYVYGPLVYCMSSFGPILKC